MKKILMILTSHEEMENTDSKTGVWLGEFTDPYYEFIDKGYQVTIASPLGGEPPIDPLSQLTENITESNRRFNDDELAKSAFKNTLMLVTIDTTNYDAVFYPGGHGPIWDLAENETSGRIILDFYHSGRPVGLVCHGPAALLKAEELQPGFLKDKRVSAFTNAEEVLTGRSGHVPYQLETRLEELGADVDSALIPFMSHVEIDGVLITGQNPLSAAPVAQALIEILEEEPVS